MKTIPFFLFFIALFTAPKLIQDPEIENSLQSQSAYLPSEKIYVQTDRTFYQPGEIVWFNAYLTNSSNEQTTTKSQIVHVQLLDPQGVVLKQLQLSQQNETFYGEFSIDKNWAGGIYKIKAFTNWMGNFGEESVFEKKITIQKSVLPKLLMKLEFEKEAYGSGDKTAAILNLRDLQDQPIVNHSLSFIANIKGHLPIQQNITTDTEGEAIIQFNLPQNLASSNGLLNVIVQHEGFTESIARKIPIVLQNIDLQFFPEGGDLVAGFTNKIAFKALNEFGDPADISGVIINENGAEVTTFQSFHDGMGAFSLNLPHGGNLKAKITQPKGISTLFDLPKFSPKHLIASLTEEESNQLNLAISTHRDLDILVVTRMNEQLFFSKKISLKKGITNVPIATDEMPVGIAQVTIFAGKDPVWERLAFVNHDRKLKFDIKTNKEAYQSREQVTMEIEVKDDADQPIPGNFSIAVVDDKLHSFADDKQPNIMAQLLLQSELKGEIHEPNFYFDEEEEKAKQALDYVMLTHGWRTFTWEEILSNSEEDWKEKVQFQPERMIVTGRVQFANKPIKNAKVWSINKDNYVLTDQNGRFILPANNLKLSQPIYVKHKFFKAQSNIHGFNYQTISRRFNQPISKETFKKKEEKLLDVFFADEEIEIKEEALELTAEEPLAIRGSRSNAQNYYIDGVRVASKDMILDEVVVTAYQVPLIEQDNTTQGKTLTSADIRRRPVRSVNALAATAAGVSATEEKRIFNYNMDIDTDFNAPILYIWTDRSSNNQFHRSRQFYTPRYHNRHSRNVKQRTDFRKTLHWQPNVKTNQNGKAQVSFFVSDEISTFRAILEGIGKGGKVGRTESTFTVNLPFAMHIKLPKIVTFGDKIRVPVVLKNNTEKEISGHLKISGVKGVFDLKERIFTDLKIPANGFLNKKIEVQVGSKIGEFPLHLSFQAEGLSEAVAETIEVAPKGFPRSISVSDKQKERAFSFDIDDFIHGSLEASFTAFPDLTSELMAGVESILREPSGCFEQTSSSSYPNTLVLQYLENQKIIDPVLRKRALGYINNGYKRLAGYEIQGGGFSLFGRVPADPLITAYGLLQFNDLKKVWDGVSEPMMKRAESWLFGHLNKRNMSGSVDDAYLVYALSESGYENFGYNKKIIDEQA